jgi:hypothetical protein
LPALREALREEDGFTVRRDDHGYIHIVDAKSNTLFATLPPLIAIYRKKAIHIFKVSRVLQTVESAHANHFLFERREGPVPINLAAAEDYRRQAAPHRVRVEKVHPPGEHHLRLFLEPDTAAAGSHAQEELGTIVDCPLGYNKLGDGLI